VAVRQFAEARTSCWPDRGSILDAVKCLLAESRKVQLKPIKFFSLMEKFLADIREKGKSRRYILDMQARLNKAAETFTG
jgi:hypothetical protein